MPNTYPNQCVDTEAIRPRCFDYIVVEAVVIAETVQANIASIEIVANVCELGVQLRLTLAYVEKKSAIPRISSLEDLKAYRQ